MFYHWKGDDLVLFVHVQTRSSCTRIVGLYGDRLKITLTSAPVDGQANADMCVLFSKVFGVSKSRIIIQKGHTQRNKRVLIPSPKKIPDIIAV